MAKSASLLVREPDRLAFRGEGVAAGLRAAAGLAGLLDVRGFLHTATVLLKCASAVGLGVVPQEAGHLWVLSGKLHIRFAQPWTSDIPSDCMRRASVPASCLALDLVMGSLIGQLRRLWKASHGKRGPSIQPGAVVSSSLPRQT